MKFVALPPQGTIEGDKYAKKIVQFSKIFLSTPTYVGGKNVMHGYDVHKTLYQIKKFMAQGSGVQALG